MTYFLSILREGLMQLLNFSINTHENSFVKFPMTKNSPKISKLKQFKVSFLNQYFTLREKYELAKYSAEHSGKFFRKKTPKHHTYTHKKHPTKQTKKTPCQKANTPPKKTSYALEKTILLKN